MKTITILQRGLFSCLLLMFIFTTSMQAQNVECWAVSDAPDSGGSGNDDPDHLFKRDGLTGMWTLIGPTNTERIENVGYDPTRDVLFTIAKDASGDLVLGELNQTTGAFVQISPSSFSDIDVLNGDSDEGIYDVDALAYDPVEDVLWASERKNTPDRDILFKVDPVTGLVIPDAFGAGFDGVEVDLPFDPVLSANVDDIDAIAIDPVSGNLYAIMNNGGDGGVLVIINKTDGSITSNLGVFNEAGSPSSPVDDMEGLTFTGDGELLGSTGDNGPDSDDSNKLFSIDPLNANAMEIQAIDPSGVYVDFESLTCFTTLATCNITVNSALPTVCDPADGFYDLAVSVTYTSGTGDITISISGGASMNFTPAGASGTETFTLTDLSSDGTIDIDVTAVYVGDGACTDTATDEYDAPANCQCSSPRCGTITSIKN